MATRHVVHRDHRFDLWAGLAALVAAAAMTVGAVGFADSLAQPEPTTAEVAP
jgi:hypothetical protein